MSRFWMWLSCLAFSFLLLGCQSAPSEGQLVFEGSLSEGRLIFREVPAGKTQERDVWLTNTGTAPVKVTALAFVGDSEDFSLTRKIVTPFTLQPGYPFRLPLRIRYESDDTEPKKVVLRVSTNNPKQTTLELPVLFENREVRLSWGCNDQLAFGQTAPGGVATKTCVLKNSGRSGSLTAMKIEYRSSKGENDVFQWQTPIMPLVIGTGEQSAVTVTIAYKPPVGGKLLHEGEFVLVGVDGDLLAIPPLKVKGEVGTRSLQVSLLPFFYCVKNSDCQPFGSELFCQQQSSGKRCVATTSSNFSMKFPYLLSGQSIRREIRLKSAGSSGVKVETVSLSKNMSGFRLVGVTLPFTIPAGKEKLLIIEYKPTNNSTGKASLQLNSDAANAQEVTIQLEALKKGCFLDIAPQNRRLEFENGGVKTLTLSNHGNSNCDISSAVMASKKNRPFQLEGLSFPLKLKPREARSLKIRFLPQSSASVVDTLYLVSNDRSKPVLAVALFGKTGSAKACDLVSAPTRMNFQETLFGTPRVQALTLTNMGWDKCRLSSISLKGGALSQFSVYSSQKTPFTIDSGQKLLLTVTYLPVLAGTVSDQVQLFYETDSGRASLSVPVTGKGKEPCLVVSPRSIAFSQTKQSCRSWRKEIAVWHTGAAHCPKKIKVLSVSFRNGKNFKLNGLLPQVPVSYGSSFAFFVTMNPAAQGTLRDTVLLKTDSNLQPQLSVSLEGKSTSSDMQLDSFTVPLNRKVDVLFVIDDSASMQQAQLAMSSQAKVFLDKARKHQADFHIGVVTTDTTGSKFAAGCLQGTTKILRTSTPNVDDALAKNFKVGTAGSALEKGMDAILAALSQPRLRDLKCNAGFLRNDARLAILVVSDENDGSQGTNNFFVRRLWALKQPKPRQEILFSTIAGPPVAGCRGNGVFAQYGARYWDISKKMDGLQLSFCDSNWKGNAELLGDLSFGPRRRFFLTRPPSLLTIKVKVDGKKLTPLSHYLYEAASNSIFFKKASSLKAGSRVEISYDVKCH